MSPRGLGFLSEYRLPHSGPSGLLLQFSSTRTVCCNCQVVLCQLLLFLHVGVADSSCPGLDMGTSPSGTAALKGPEAWHCGCSPAGREVLLSGHGARGPVSAFQVLLLGCLGSSVPQPAPATQGPLSLVMGTFKIYSLHSIVN